MGRDCQNLEVVVDPQSAQANLEEQVMHPQLVLVSTP